MMTVIQAIAKMEGWGVPGARPTRDNNPGDICAGVFCSQHGADGVDGRFAHFPTPEAGLAALRALLVKHYVGLTLAAVINRYAPPVENQTNRYIECVCRWTGYTPETVLTVENIG